MHVSTVNASIFTASAANTSAEATPAWFTCLGLPLTQAEAGDVAAYLSKLGYAANTPVEIAQSWREVEALLKRPDWDAAWWQAEDNARLQLMQAAGDSNEVAEALNLATDATTEALHGAAAMAALRESVGDAYLPRVAAGAALQAVHQRALALLAHAPDHAFTHKYALFASGHWVLGFYNQRLFLF
jgi:hypothetical protein